MPHSRRSGKVLIVSPHVMTSALVGWFVELAKLEPAFVDPGERPEDALARVRPVLVLLLDAEVHGALNDLLLARAMKRGAGVAVFSGGVADDNARGWAARNGIPFFSLPLDLAAFSRVLDVAARRGAGDRRVAERRAADGSTWTDRALDGTLVLHDGEGRWWYVYDRRGGDRRHEDRGYRAFVDRDGVERRLPLAHDADEASEPEVLIGQLARATEL